MSISHWGLFPLVIEVTCGAIEWRVWDFDTWSYVYYRGGLDIPRVWPDEVRQ